MEKLVIDRTKWLRGEGPDESYLLRQSDSKMCCLGFYGMTCGLSEENILGRQAPISLGGKDSWLFTTSGGYSEDCYNLMRENDYKHISDVEREKRIIETFAKHGVEVVFEG